MIANRKGFANLPGFRNWNCLDEITFPYYILKLKISLGSTSSDASISMIDVITAGRRTEYVIPQAEPPTWG